MDSHTDVLKKGLTDGVCCMLSNEFLLTFARFSAQIGEFGHAAFGI